MSSHQKHHHHRHHHHMGGELKKEEAPAPAAPTAVQAEMPPAAPANGDMKQASSGGAENGAMADAGAGGGGEAMADSGEPGAWHQEICGCMDNQKICCCSFCCHACQACRSAEDLGESGPLYWILACLIPPSIIMLRMKVREKYKLEGGMAEDLLFSCCCTCCAIAQFAAEIEYRGDHKEME